MRTQMRNELVSRFEDEYASELRRDEEVKIEGAIKSLELLDTYLRVGWTEEAEYEATAFEERFGIPIRELADETSGKHLAELR